MSDARPGLGTKLQRGDGGGSEVFTTVAEVLSISGPSPTLETIDVTSMLSTAREHKPVIVDNGEVTLAVNLVDSDAQQQGLFTDQANKTLRNFKVVVNNHSVEGSKSTRSFAALVTNISDEYPFDQVMARNVTLKISGAVTRTFAAAE